VRVVTINTHAIKTVLLALTAAASFAAAIIVGMGLGAKQLDFHQAVSCEPGAAASTAVASAVPAGSTLPASRGAPSSMC
jgi:hypothetical protein